MAGTPSPARAKPDGLSGKPEGFEDLSGIAPEPGANPYNALIAACSDTPHEMQRLYALHRARRNAQQRQLFLAPGFARFAVDQHLLRLERPHLAPGFRDERHCLVFWARPPIHVLRLAARLQDLLRRAAPGIWLMPTYRMHMTALEVAFCRTPDDIAALVAALRPAMPAVASYTHAHRARLVKPMLSYDLAAVAVSFLPAAGEPPLSPAPTAPDPREGVTQGDAYTYHHLRRDLFDRIREAGVDVASRYQVPSAHITLARYLDDSDHDTPDKRAKWIAAIDDINGWLERDVWDKPDAEFVGEWVVGHEKGLDARDGALWFGGGRTIMMGEGF